MKAPWPPEVGEAIVAYHQAVRRWHEATEAIPYTDVELALLQVGNATVSWAARIDRLPAARPRAIAAAGGRRA